MLRCALLKQQRQLSYEELAFHLEDSASFRAFARLPLGWSPKKSVLHQTISAIGAETWETINRALIAAAQEAKVEAGAMVRIDSTVTAALMHEAERQRAVVGCRAPDDAAAAPGGGIARGTGDASADHRRMAKRCATEIQYSRGKDQRRRLYRKLIAAVYATRAALQRAAGRLAELPASRPSAGMPRSATICR